MYGIDFIGPNLNSSDDQREEEILKIPGLPKPYRKDNLLSRHLVRAAYMDALFLTHKNHINLASREGFKCISYYSEYQAGSAFCSREECGYLATMSAPFVRRLIKISSLIEPALNHWFRKSSDTLSLSSQPTFEQSSELNSLLEGKVDVAEFEALDILSSWPTEGNQHNLGGYTLFYDLIRLIWYHEWAHALCGHVMVAKTDLGLSRLHEFSTERASADADQAVPFPRNEILQGIELHADEFAVRSCLYGILWGYDPMAEIAGPKINLLNRLLIFNTAFCIFAVVWSLLEKKYAQEDTLCPPPRLPDSDTPYPLFVPTKSTHPPASLRYDRFRAFQRDFTVQYALEQGNQGFSALVDAHSLSFLKCIGEISRYFLSLEVITPMIARTPTQKRLIAYEKHLLTTGSYLFPKLEEYCYRPSSGT